MSESVSSGTGTPPNPLLRIVGWIIGVVCFLLLSLIALAMLFGMRLPASGAFLFLVAIACVPATWRLPNLRAAPVWARCLLIVALALSTFVWGAAHYKGEPDSPVAASTRPQPLSPSAPALAPARVSAPADGLAEIDCRSADELDRDTRYISRADASVLCNELADINEANGPQREEFKSFLKAVFVYEVTAKEHDYDMSDDPKSIGKSLLSVVRVRGLGKDPARVVSTLDLVWRMTEASHGRVLPDKVSAFLRSSGPMAHTLSDEGIANLLPLIDSNAADGTGGG
jgi:hypothetical protein